MTITLTAACDTSGTEQVPSDQPGTRLFQRPASLVPQYSEVRYYTFPGGCATYQFPSREVRPRSWPPLSTTRWRSCRGRRWSATSGAPQGLALCGRGAACPG